MKHQTAVETKKQNQIEAPLLRGLWPRPATRPMADHAVPAPPVPTAAGPNFNHDFSQVPVHTTPPLTIQPKLTIGQPNDKYEQEADRIADLVMRMPEPCGQCQGQSEEEETLRTKPLSTPVTPLLQQQVEPEGEGKKAIQAKGNDVVFGLRPYLPVTFAGRSLLADEPVHVMQQGVANVEPNTIQREIVTRLEGGEVQEGEEPEQQMTTGVRQPAIVGASMQCTPIGLPRRNFLRQPGTTQEDFGLTRLDPSQVTYPQIHLTRLRGGRYRVQRTATILPPIPSVYTQAASPGFTEGTRILSGRDPYDRRGCDAGRYPVRWIIQPEGAQRIAEGEQEHCDDFEYAFNITLRRYAEAVNRLADSRRIFSSRRDVEGRLTREVGIAPRNWRATFSCLAEKSELRDNRPRRWHTPRPLRLNPRQRTGCAYFTYRVTAHSLPQVGQHPSSEIIRGCGERS